VKLPNKVWSQLGPISIDVKALTAPAPGADPDFGGWIPAKREIELHADLCARAAIATLFHEMTHVALWDAGGENIFNEQQKEFICDAVGSYLAGAALAGFLVLRVPKE
jgi:hypothetical protein